MPDTDGVDDRATIPDTDSIEMLDEIRFLSQSDTRVRVLAFVSECDRPDRYDLESRLNVSRRTVLRTINALIDRGYVVDRKEGYELTALGEHVHDCCTRFASRLVSDDGLREFLSHVPQDVFGFDVGRLSDAAVTTATEASPYAPLDHLLATRRESTCIRELAPAVESRSVTQLAERIRNGEDIDVEIIIEQEALQTARDDDRYADAQAVVEAADAVDLYAYPSEFPLAVGLLDGMVTLVADDGSRPAALVETDDPAVREWAEGFLDRHRAEAAPVAD